MKCNDSWPFISPLQFEQYVHALLADLGKDLDSFTSEHRVKLPGLDGEYEIDIAASFKAMGANFEVLVECKCYQHSIKRDIVQVLHDRIRSLGKHKGMIFATSNYQKGAIEYATHHGVALIRVGVDDLRWETRRFPRIPQESFRPIISWLVHPDPDNCSPTILDNAHVYLANMLFQKP